MMTDVQTNDGLNEKLLKLMCLNQAIDKLNREVSVLTSVRDQIISVMDEEVQSDKLENLLLQMK